MKYSSALSALFFKVHINFAPVNTFGVLHGIRAFVPVFLRQGEPAHVINTVSMAGLTYGPMSSAYFMSKHAALALSESLYLELKAKNAPVGVTVVCPELVATKIGESERNRPLHLKRGDAPASPERDAVERAIQLATTTQGIPAAEIAERAIAAMREERFYALAPEGDAWRRQRRMVMHGFDPAHVRSYHPALQRVAQRLHFTASCENWRK